MKYIAILNEGVIVAKAKNFDDAVCENEIELTVEQYNTISIPCKLVDGEFIDCDFPKTEVDGSTNEPEQTSEPTTSELMNILLGVTDNE